MKKTILSLILLSAAASSFAWGQRERDVLIGGIVGGIITNEVNRGYYPPVYPQAPVYQTPRPVVIVPPPAPICGVNVYCGPTTCYNQPIQDAYGNTVGFQQVCR